MTLRLRSLDQASAPAWDRFVASMPAGTFFHCAAWSHVIEKAFNHRSHYVFAEQDGTIAGVLPLAHVKTKLFGNRLISTPFCVYGGPLAVDREAAVVLEAYADALRQRLGASAIEMRERQPAEGDWLVRSNLYVTFRKPIAADDATNLKAIPRKQRAMVRKGVQNGLRSVRNRDVTAFHRVYSESVRNLGTPVFARSYFSILQEAFADCSDIVTIMDAEHPIASALNFYFRDEVTPYYAGGTRKARLRAGNDFLFWEVMRRATARGCRVFDFGRSKRGTGSFAFKHNWGFEAEPLHYRYHLAPGTAIPDHNPLNPKYRLLIAVWKRLPLTAANVLGPAVVRGLG